MSSNIFLIIALVTTGIFAVQFVLSIFFGDINADADIDTDISSVVSFKGLTHFGIGFGWYMYLQQDTDVISYIVGILVGVVSLQKGISIATGKPFGEYRTTGRTRMYDLL